MLAAPVTLAVLVGCSAAPASDLTVNGSASATPAAPAGSEPSTTPPLVETPTPAGCTAERHVSTQPQVDWPAPPFAVYRNEPSLQAVLNSFVEEADQHASIVVMDVTRGVQAVFDPTRFWYAASLYKFPLAVEAAWRQEQGTLAPDETYALNCVYVPDDLGTMALLGHQTDDLITAQEAVHDMVVASDNSLAQLVADVLDADQVDDHLRSVGLTGTSVSHRALPTTASDMARLATLVATGYPTPESAAAVQALLAQQRARSRIPAGIDDATAIVGNKTADWPGLSAHDVAIVRASFGTYVLVILTDGSLADEFFARVASAVHNALRTRAVAATLSATAPHRPR
jgi:beta-lactamase class A